MKINTSLELLEHSRMLLSKGKVNTAMNCLYFDLYACMLSQDLDSWNDLVKTCRSHPILHSIHASPISRRAFQKPRGYAGDAVLMDHLYRYDERFDNPIYRWEFDMLGSKSVRQRRRLIAREIEKLAVEKEKIGILSVACGHLREALDLTDNTRAAINQYYAIDADPESLEEISSNDSYPNAIKTVNVNIIDIIKEKCALPQFDLIYSLGLTDYLSDRIAGALLTKLFDRVREGGALFIANFAPNLIDRAYIDAFMDWHLIYRNEDDMERLVKKLNFSKIELFRDDYKNIVYLKIKK